MLSLGSEDGFLLLISILPLTSFVLNFAFIVMFLGIHEKERIHRLVILLNLSFLAATVGLFGYLSSKSFVEIGQDQGLFWIFIFPSVVILYAGLSSASVHWLHLAACYSEKKLWTQGWRRFIAYIPGVITITILFFLLHLKGSAGQTSSLADYRLANVLLFISATAFECIALILYLRTMLDKRHKRAIAMSFASLLPMIGGAPYLLSRLFPLPFDSHLSITILFITIILGNTILALALFQRKALELLPKAIHEIFYGLKEAVIIIDQDRKLIYSNAYAREIFPNIEMGGEMSEQTYQIGTTLEKMQEDSLETLDFEMSLKGFMYSVRIQPILRNDHASGWIILLTDITKVKHTEEQLLHNALHDRLTKLPNRTLLMDRLKHAIFNAQRDENFKYAILSMDLDWFKRINDSLGRETGDQILVEVAKRLQTCLRKVDTVARMEGDEFVILLERISGVRAATEVSLRVIDLLSQPIHLNDQELFTSVSIGIVMGSQHHKNPDDILREGDIALLEAKERGRSQYVLYDKEMQSHISTLFDLETKLRSAIENNEFVLHYQPILSLSEQRISGFEALLRWNHPEHGIMLPSEFLPELESSDLIVPIGQWQIQQACHDLSNWNAIYSMDPPLVMQINLSQRELTAPDFSDVLTSTLEDIKLNSSCLAFEIKEEMLMERETEISDILISLKSIGVHIVIDQFGTGNSSFQILSSFPVDTIKIDRSFIRNIPRSIKDYEIVKHMIDLGHSLKIRVIAEGVEAPHEYVELKSMRCEYVQGDYFYKPLPQDTVILLLEKMTKRKQETSKMDHRKLFNSAT